jgi:DNA (cytosine-5)-methyltransferase 1
MESGLKRVRILIRSVSISAQIKGLDWGSLSIPFYSGGERPFQASDCTSFLPDLLAILWLKRAELTYICHWIGRQIDQRWNQAEDAFLRVKMSMGRDNNSPSSAIDLFCGAGGLTYGLRKAGIDVQAGIDIDPESEFAYTQNNPGSAFYRWDVRSVNYNSLEQLFSPGKIRLLAGCAPCQPFSKLTNGKNEHESWDLLANFGRFVKGIKPDLVTMENVPELAHRGREVFDKFLATLKTMDYWVDWRIVNCTSYRIPQTRNRLVLVASRLGPIEVPKGKYPNPNQWKTVKEAIGKLAKLKHGESDPDDPLHVASKLSPLNLERIKSTKRNGGTWKDWPDRLVLDCHKKESGKSFSTIYGRMWNDQPAPTMTTLCTGLGNGRFGHPTQNRPISLREASLLQTFPRRYEFWPAGTKLNKGAISRMIGNAVPPTLAKNIGLTLFKHVEPYLNR